MIPYIDKQLILWAAWENSGKTQLGYPKKSAFVITGRSGPTTIDDETGINISRCVAALDPPLGAIVDCWYRRMTHCTADQIADHFNICRDTLYARLHKAQVEIMGSLQDIAAGLPIKENSKTIQKNVTPPDDRHAQKIRTCLSCGKKFDSYGANNRRCKACKQRGANIYAPDECLFRMT